MNDSREGFCRTGRGRSFHADGPKAERVREPTVLLLLDITPSTIETKEGGRIGLRRLKGNQRHDAGWPETENIKLDDVQIFPSAGFIWWLVSWCFDFEPGSQP